MKNTPAGSPAKKKQPAKPKNVRMIAIIAAVLVAASASAWLIWGRGSLPNPSKMDRDQFREYVQSDAFRNAPDDQRREFFGTFMRENIMKQVNDYYNLPEDRRQDYLDKTIDEMVAMRERFRQNRPEGQEPRQRDANRPRQAPDNSQIRQRSENISGEDRAKMTAFRKALNDRMQERGMEPMRGPGGGGGGFGGPGGGPGGGSGPGRSG